MLAPQPHTVWSDRSASAYELHPPDSAVTPERPLTGIGVERLVVVPSPSWPLLLSPAARTVPSDFSASEPRLAPAIVLVHAVASAAAATPTRSSPGSALSGATLSVVLQAANSGR